MSHEYTLCACSHCRYRRDVRRNYSCGSVLPVRLPHEHVASFSAFKQLLELDSLFLDGEQPEQQ